MERNERKKKKRESRSRTRECLMTFGVGSFAFGTLRELNRPIKTRGIHDVWCVTTILYELFFLSYTLYRIPNFGTRMQNVLHLKRSKEKFNDGMNIFPNRMIHSFFLSSFFSHLAAIWYAINNLRIDGWNEWKNRAYTFTYTRMEWMDRHNRNELVRIII